MWRSGSLIWISSMPSGCSQQCLPPGHIFGATHLIEKVGSKGRLALHIFHRRNSGLGLHAHPCDSSEQVNDFFFVVCESICIELFTDGRVLWFPFLILIEDPLQGRTGAEPVLPSFLRNS